MSRILSTGGRLPDTPGQTRHTPPGQTAPGQIRSWADTILPSRWLLQRTVRILLQYILVRIKNLTSLNFWKPVDEHSSLTATAWVRLQAPCGMSFTLYSQCLVVFPWGFSSTLRRAQNCSNWNHLIRLTGLARTCSE